LRQFRGEHGRLSGDCAAQHAGDGAEQVLLLFLGQRGGGGGRRGGFSGSHRDRFSGGGRRDVLNQGKRAHARHRTFSPSRWRRSGAGLPSPLRGRGVRAEGGNHARQAAVVGGLIVAGAHVGRGGGPDAGQLRLTVRAAAVGRQLVGANEVAVT